MEKTEVNKLKERIEALKEENQFLVKKIEEKDQIICHMKKSLEKIFTPGQVRKLLKRENTNVRWNPEDIASAISLRSVSPKAYRYLRSNSYPLPALSTLRTWAATFDLKPGILNSVCSLLKGTVSSLSTTDKLCILSFDEMYVSNRIDIEKKYEEKIGPHKSCQTVMVRGLVKNWKQPIYFKFDQSMTVDIIKSIIKELYHAGLTVVAIVSDMGTGNTGLWSKLGIGYDKSCHFSHPSDNNLNVYVFADVPHLIKLVRNHLLDQGFDINGKKIDKTCFQILADCSISDLRIAHKLTKFHLEVKGSERQKVRPAVQLLSNSTAKAISYLGKNGFLPENIHWQAVADFCKFMNDWFDLMNSRNKFSGSVEKNAFGTDLEIQQELLDQVSRVVSSMVVGKHKSILPFQKGILLTSKSITELYRHVKSTYGVEYILTSRLNQDVLENFFSYIRGMGGANDHPNPLDFVYRLRWYILGKNSAAIFTCNKNTEETMEETCLVKPLEKNYAEISNEVCLSNNILLNLVKQVEIPVEKPDEVEESLMAQYDFVEPSYTELHLPETEDANSHSDSGDLLSAFEMKETIHEEALKFVAGYVAHRFRGKYQLGVESKEIQIINTNCANWLSFISRGNLLYPNESMLKAAQVMEEEFNKMHGTTLASEKYIFKKLAERAQSRLIVQGLQTVPPFEVLLCLSRTRTYIRLRDLNRRISFKNCKKRLEKKMSKFTNKK